MKKGATHADWAISLGIFLVYILSMFMIIQPGSEPIYRNEKLTGIIKEGIYKDATFVLTKTPLVITPIPENFTAGSYTIEITDSLPFKKGGNKAAVFNENLQYVQNAKIDLSAKKIAFTTPIDKKTTFWVYEVQTDKTGTEYEYDNFFQQAETTITPEKANFTYSFGATETIEGIDSSVLSKLFEQGGIKCTIDSYKQPLKLHWNYPLNKDFAVYYVPKSSPIYAENEKIDICSPVQPYAQAQVSVEEWAENAIDKEGKLTPLRINIRVW